MKTNLTLIILVVTGFIFHTQAQSIYAKLQGGYGLATQKQVIGTYYALTYDENIYASFGGGLNLQGAAGYMFNDYIGFECLLGFQTGQKATVPGMLSKEYKGSLISFSPSFVFYANTAKKVNPYLKGGLLTGLPLMKVTVNSTDIKKFRGGFPFGYAGSLGIKFKLGKNAGFFAEFCHNSLIYNPTKRIESDKSVVKFLDKIDYPYPSGFELRHHLFPFSSTGLNAGLIILIPLN